VSEQPDRLVDRGDLARLFERLIPFNRHLGLQVQEIGDGTARIRAPFSSVLIGNPVTRAIHGGVISALLDSCAGLAVWSQIGPDDILSTVDLRVDYLRPAGPEDLIAAAEVVRLGNRVAVVSLRSFHPGTEERPFAAGTAVYNVRRTSPEHGADLWRRVRLEPAQG
jgi:uncharacterized protein (TIGR00369 family)